VRMRSRNPWVRDRRRLFGWKVRLLTVDLPITGSPSLVPVDARSPGTTPSLPTDGAQNSPTPRGRPYKATHPRQAGPTRVPVVTCRCPLAARPRPARRHAAHSQMLASEHILWHSAALVSVRALGWPDGSGSPAAPRKLCRASGGFRCGSPYLRAQLWTTLWMLPVSSGRDRVRRGWRAVRGGSEG
jgi:hypothetical protein